jgi:hypothetical protein
MSLVLQRRLSRKHLCLGGGGACSLPFITTSLYNVDIISLCFLFDSERASF